MTTGKDSTVEGGTQGEATPEGSNNQPGERGSSAEYVTVEQFKELQRGIDTLTRSLQSNKDRAVKQTNERLEVVEGDLRKVLQSYQKNGRTNIDDVLADIDAAEEAETRQALRELALSFKAGKLPEKESGGTETKTGVDVSGIVSEFELDTNDLRVRDFAAKKFASEGEAYRAAVALAKQIATTQPSEADKPSEVAKRQQAPSNQEALMREYQEGSKNLRGQALINYKMKMRSKGLRIS